MTYVQRNRDRLKFVFSPDTILRIQAMEMRCYRKILHIAYKDLVTNEVVSPCKDPAGNRTTRRPDHG